MKCKIEYQYRPKTRSRPDDTVQEVIIDPALPVPNIGDHVHIDEEGWDGYLVVENRLFSYMRGSSEPWLIINIVLTDSAVDSGKLLKS